MSTRFFHGGWGSQFEMSRYAHSLLKPLFDNKPDNTIIIDSTWYTDKVHAEVCEYYKHNQVDRIIMFSFNDAQIARYEMFREKHVPVYELGYYYGPYFFDFWANVIKDKYTLPTDEELLDHTTVVKPYLSYNRKPHEHRLELYNNLVDRGIVDQGIVTMDKHRQLDQDIDNYITSAPEAGSVIVNDILSLGRQDIWNQCFLNIVTETWPDINRAYFVSEKIYKPIVGLRPFFVYTKDLGNKWLHDRGFLTYEKDFLDIYPEEITQDNLVDFLVVLCEASKNISWLQTKFISLKDKMIYNKQRFYEYVKERDINRLIDEILTDSIQ